MMRRWIWTRHVSEWDADAQKYRRIDSECRGYWYDGPLALGMDSPTITQDSIQVFNDDGTDETDSTQKANVGVDITGQALDENLLVRFLIKETAGNSSGNTGGQLQVRLNGGIYQNVDAISTIARSSASTKLVEKDDATQRIGAGTFVTTNEGQDENDGSAGKCNLVGNDEFEVVFCLQIRTADVSGGDNVEFRISDADIDSYIDPEIKVTLAGVGGQTISGTVGEIATGYVGPSQTLALAARQVISGTVGEIATGYVGPSQTIALSVGVQTISGTVGEISTGYVGPSQTIALSTPQTISGTVGEISTGYVGPSQTIALAVAQAISGTVGEIATGFASPTDTQLNIPGQPISGTVGEISTGYVGPSQTIALAARQTISGTVGEISTGFVGPTDQTIALAARLAITGAVGEIASGEIVPSDAVISDVVLAITGAGGILTGELFANDHVIGLPAPTVALRSGRRLLLRTFYDGGRGVR